MIPFAGEVLAFGQSGTSPANDEVGRLSIAIRSPEPAPSPWTPSPLKPAPGRFAASRELLLLPGAHGPQTFAVPFGWMAPAPQYPVRRCAAVNRPHQRG